MVSCRLTPPTLCIGCVSCLRCLLLDSRVTFSLRLSVSGRSVLIFSSFLFLFFPVCWHPFIRQPMDDSPQLHATSGIAYYMSPPYTFKEAILDTIHTLIYIDFMLSACAIFSKTWIEVSGSSPHDVAKQLKEQQIVCFSSFNNSLWWLTTIRSWLVIARDPCTKNLNVSSPPLPLLVVPSLDYSVAADLSGAIGSGTGILMAVTIIHSCKLSFNFCPVCAYSQWSNEYVILVIDCEIGMHEAGGPGMAAFQDLL